MSEIPVHLLYALVHYSRANSVGEAARTLRVTQPALSKQLSALQSHFKSPLFSYEGKRKVLTPLGLALSRKLGERLGDLQNLVVQATNEFSPSPRIRLGARREILDRVVDQLRFDGRIEFFESSHEQILDWVLSRKLDFGVTHEVPDTHKLISRPLFREKFRIAVPKTLCPRSPFSTDARSLGDLPCLAYKEQDSVLSKACEKQGLEFSKLRVARIIADYTLIAKMVDAGLGWAVIPVHLPVSRDANWFFDLSPQGFHPREFKIVFRSDLSRAAWRRTFISDLASKF